MDTASPASSDDQASPVTWHVIVWVLLSLAINSLAQSSSRWGATSLIYLSISPIVCVADALSLLVTIPCAWYILGGSFGAAFRYALFWRRKRDTDEDSLHNESPDQASWLKWILFIIGTAPALIKLAAFSGLPWSKTWGLMYGVSYLVIEFVSIISTFAGKELPRSNAEALGCSLDTWDKDANQGLRQKAKDLDFAMICISLLLLLVAGFCQAALVLWALYDLRPYRFFAEHDIWMPSGVYEVMAKIAIGVTFGWAALKAVVWILWIIFAARRAFSASDKPWRRLESLYQHLTKWDKGIDALYYVVIGLVGFLTSREVGSQWATKGAHSLVSGAWAPTFIACTVVYYSISMFWRILCSRVPRIARFLLVTKQVKVVDVSNPEITTTVDQVDSRGVLRLTIFCIEILIAVLWYAIRYDPEGTVNPAWTDIFG